jgi:hypothetical protein
MGMKILVGVTAYTGENPVHLKPKGLPAMLINWQLGESNPTLSRSWGKRNWLIFQSHRDTFRGDAKANS